MQCDTQLTLREILNGRDAFLKIIEEMIDLALVQVTEDEPIKLQFIIPDVPLEQRNSDPSRRDCTLTLPEKHRPGKDYIAVSYC
jgi:hypothetical protein